MATSEATLHGDDRNFRIKSALLGMVGFGLSACVSTAPAAATNATTLNSGDSAKRAFMISDAADRFSSVSAADAKDCRSYAVFVGVAGLSTNVFAGPTPNEKKAAKDVMDVWTTVFDRKPEGEQAEALENRQARVEARQNGSGEKLSAKKCIHPVLSELGYEMVEA